MSFGLLSESALVPKKAKPIAGVAEGSMVDLRAAIMEASERKSRQEADAAGLRAVRWRGMRRYRPALRISAHM